MTRQISLYSTTTLLLGLALVTVACGDSSTGESTTAASDSDSTMGSESDASTDDSESAGTMGSGSESETGGDATTGAEVCSSQMYWTMGDLESPLMHPGGACLNCHNMAEPGEDIIGRFAIAGTVYETLHELDDCFGASDAAGPITVEITTADDQVVNLAVNSAGNFFYDLEESPPLMFPIMAKVKRGDQEIAMGMSQESGDCNSCHTKEGLNGAPGRILAP